MIMMVLLCMMQDLKNSVLNTRGGACSERRRKYIPVGLSAASMPQALSTQALPRVLNTDLLTDSLTLVTG